MFAEALGTCEEQCDAMQVERSKRGIIEAFLEELGRARTRDEATRLTEKMLKGYKGESAV